MFQYHPTFKVLVCTLHKYAVADPEAHLRQAHNITGQEKDRMLAQWEDLELAKPEDIVNPHQPGEMGFLAPPKNGYACVECPFLTIKWLRMRHHYGTAEAPHSRKGMPEPPTTWGSVPGVRQVSLQTLFPAPFIRWFEVDTKSCWMDPIEFEAMRHRIESPNVEEKIAHEERMNNWDEWYDSRHQRQEEARHKAKIAAIAAKAHNSQQPFFCRLPMEIRLMIYQYAVPSDVTYHLIDSLADVKPHLEFAMNTDEHDDEYDDDGIETARNIREEWEDMLYEQSESVTAEIRCISVPQNSHDFALLHVSNTIYSEARPFLYSQNGFCVHSGFANHVTALDFLSAIGPKMTKLIRDFGVIDIQPCAPKPFGRFGIYNRDEEFRRKAKLFAHYDRVFLSDSLPKMSALKRLHLGFDLSHMPNLMNFEEEDDKERITREYYSPQAFWLNGYLRLPLEQIDLEFDDLDWKDGVGDAEDDLCSLMRMLNHVDKMTKIRARDAGKEPLGKWYKFWDEFPGVVRMYEEQRRPMFPYNDIWAV